VTSRHADVYETVLEVGATLTGSLDLEQVLATIARQVGEALDVQYCDIHEYDAANDTMTCAAEWTPLPDPDEEAYVGTVVPIDERDGVRAVLEDGVLLEEYVDDAALREGERDLMLRWGELASLEAPLVYGDEVLGVLCVAERERRERRFSVEDKHLLELLAGPAAIAMRNARAYRDRAEHTRRLAAVLAATLAITATMDLDEVLSSVGRAVAEVADVSQSVIYEYESATDSIVYRALHERFAPPDVEPDDELGTKYALDAYPGDRAILAGGTVVVEHASDPDLPDDRKASMTAWDEKTVLSVPLAFRGEPVGILRLYDMVEERPFELDEIELIRSMGELASAALHNARLYRARKVHSARLLGLFDTSRALSSTFDPGTVAEAVVQGARQLFVDGAEADVWLRAGGGGFTPAGAAGEDLGAGPEAAASAVRPPAVAREALDALRPAQVVDVTGSSLVVPLVAKGRAEGFVEVVAPGKRAFLDGEIEAVQVLANQAAVALANASLYRQVQEQAVRDGLTGLYNHRFFQERLNQECARARRYGLPLSLLMIDVDDFKRFNDQHGHQMGDEVLCEVGRILAGSVRAGVDIPARYGGEEFAVILPHTTVSGARCVGHRLCEKVEELGEELPPRGSGAVIVGERLREAIATQAFAGRGGRRYAHLTVSIGVATLDQGDRRADGLVSNADKALYVAKRSGKNRTEVFEDSASPDAEDA
jgi:diguanylate cyclase (GGDEF)-like protein